MAGHVAPEAVRGGPIGLVSDGDTITLDVTSPPPRRRPHRRGAGRPRRGLHAATSGRSLASRSANTPSSSPARPRAPSPADPAGSGAGACAYAAKIALEPQPSVAERVTDAASCLIALAGSVPWTQWRLSRICAPRGRNGHLRKSRGGLSASPRGRRPRSLRAGRADDRRHRRARRRRHHFYLGQGQSHRRSVRARQDRDPARRRHDSERHRRHRAPQPADPGAGHATIRHLPDQPVPADQSCRSRSSSSGRAGSPGWPAPSRGLNLTVTAPTASLRSHFVTVRKGAAAAALQGADQLLLLRHLAQLHAHRPASPSAVITVPHQGRPARCSSPQRPAPGRMPRPPPISWFPAGKAATAVASPPRAPPSSPRRRSRSPSPSR